jgi:hypothetical protein
MFLWLRALGDHQRHRRERGDHQGLGVVEMGDDLRLKRHGARRGRAAVNGLSRCVTLGAAGSQLVAVT